ncbi:MAG: SDR family NAD(P)-dependent oxidoreductase [Bacteroidota bacterium]
MQPVPRMATYAATKAFVKHFSQSLQQEMEEQGKAVRFMTVCPSATKNTAFQQTAKMEGVRTFRSLTTTTPEEVARDAYQGFLRGKKTVYSGAGLRRALWLQRFMPAGIVHWALKRELDRT